LHLSVTAKIISSGLKPCLIFLFMQKSILEIQ
jgi:hypothetical protein